MSSRKGQSSVKYNLLRSLAVLSALSTTACALSLAEFHPVARDLTPACEKHAYTVTIPGCKVSDFNQGATCTQACLEGLVFINTRVNEYCHKLQDYKLLVGDFLNGKGISTLCPGVLVVTPPPTTPPHPTRSSTKTTQSSPSPSFHGTTTLKRTSVRKTGILTDTSSSPSVSSPFTTSRHHTSHTSSNTITSVTHKSHSVPTTTHSTSSSRSSTPPAAAESAAESKCVEYNGDPFSSCPNSLENNASRFSTPIILILSPLIIGIFFSMHL